eukprot:1154634-Pelagomonas_calceolata.AAC.5
MDRQSTAYTDPDPSGSVPPLVTLHTILLGVGGVIYTPHTLEPLNELGLDTHEATRLARKLHAHSVQFPYKLASTRRS